MTQGTDPTVPPVSSQDDEDEDLWFLPGPPEDVAPTDPPWQIANRPAEFPVGRWMEAERRNGQALAGAAAEMARLDERLRMGPKGLDERLALMEVTDQLWAQGDWMSAEKIALYRHLRLSTLQDAQVLSQADWAVRRMLSGVGPRADDSEGLAGFLGRHETQSDGLEAFGKRPFGADFERLEARWHGLLDSVKTAHPLTRAAVAFYGWRSLGLSEPGCVLEPMAAIGAIATSGNRGGLKFLPAALGDKYLLGRSGQAETHLAQWYHGVENACLRALLHLDQLQDWHLAALAKTQDLSGKTPPSLIASLTAMPLVSAEIVARRAGVSTVAALRNLTLFADRGLVREVTGQDRYRFWTAKI